MTSLLLALVLPGAPLAVAPANAAAPTVSAVRATTSEDSAIRIALSGADADADALTFAATSRPAHGEITVAGSVVSYTPDPDWNGYDSFNYRATDATGAVSRPATVAISTSPVNDAPTATDVSASTGRGTPVSIRLAGADVDGDSLTYTLTSAPASGAVTIVRGMATYTPGRAAIGTDRFTYAVSDPSGSRSRSATVTITINAMAAAPVATDTSASGSEDTPLTFTLSASDSDGDSLTCSTVRAPTYGSVAYSGCVATYTPNADFSGLDTFTWRASDGRNTDDANATLTIAGVNDAPVANNVSGSGDEDTTINIRLTGSDVDSAIASYTLVDSPANGGVIISGNTAQYRPPADWNGTDSFTYVAVDTEGATSGTATATVTVNPVNDPPMAYNTVAATAANATVIFPPTAVDPEGDPYTAVLDSAPRYGRAAATRHGFRYTPWLGYHGADRFTWHVEDAEGNRSSTVTTQVNVHTRPMLNRPDMPQLGLNAIQFGLDDSEFPNPENAEAQFQPENIFADFERLGAQIYRQVTNGDTTWSSIQVAPGSYNEPDYHVVDNGRYQPTATLFELQYASPTPPYCVEGEPFQKYMGEDAYGYLDFVLDRFGGWLDSYEVGNEMYHWVAASGKGGGEGAEELPDCIPEDGYLPAEQAVFVEEASRYIKAGDPNAIVTLASINTAGEASEAWLLDLIGAAGDTDWFDVISYHSYDDWTRDYQTRRNLQNWLEEAGITDKLVRLTETGTTSDADYTSRTDYPNSDESQSADIFRLPLIGWAQGDATVIWHTYIPVTDQPGGEFQGFEIVEHDGTWKPSAYAFQLLSENLVPFKQITEMTRNGVYQYRIDTEDDEIRYVVWGAGEYTVPAGMTEYTTVYPEPDGSFDWISIEAGDVLTLGDTPMLLR